MKLDLDPTDIANLQICIARVMKLPEVDMTGIRSLLLLHDKIEKQKSEVPHDKDQ
jgi:hypothetical protein